MSAASRLTILLVIVALASSRCSLMGLFDESPCFFGDSREVDNGCGVCGTGRASQACTPRRTWETTACSDPLDADGDTYAGPACDDLPGGCCTSRRDCNDANDAVHPDAFDCLPGAAMDCVTACGTEGSGLCTESCELPRGTGCRPPTEACANGIDDDCDTVTDELDPGQCAPGTTVSCTTTCGSAGSGTCTAGCLPPRTEDCTPPSVELCNRVDDDCDTETDEELPCLSGTTVDCTTPCGTAGTGTCTAACEIPSGTACTTAEVCNGCDDDGDTAPDDGLPCVQGEPTACTTACGSTGTGTCSDACEIPDAAACTLPAETCSGADDDCDGRTDERLWCPVAVGATGGFRAVHGSSATDVWAGGSTDPGLLRWDGSSWSAVADLEAPVWGIWAHSPSVVWLARGQDTMRRDGGAFAIVMTEMFTTNVLAVWGFAADDVWVVAQMGIIRHFDGGETSTLGSSLHAVWGAAPDDVWAAGVGCDGVRHWDGAEWTDVATGLASSGEIHGIWGAAAADVWFVGDCGGGAVRWDGSGWATLALEDYVGGPGTVFRALWGFSSTDVWVVGDAGAIGHWDGTAWSEVPSGTTETLYDIWGASPSEIWAVGSNGTILRWRE